MTKSLTLNAVKLIVLTVEEVSPGNFNATSIKPLVQKEWFSCRRKITSVFVLASLLTKPICKTTATNRDKVTTAIFVESLTTVESLLHIQLFNKALNL